MNWNIPLTMAGVAVASAAALVLICPQGSRWLAAWLIGHALRVEHIRAEITAANNLARQASADARASMVGR